MYGGPEYIIQIREMFGVVDLMGHSRRTNHLIARASKLDQDTTTHTILYHSKQYSFKKMYVNDHMFCYFSDPQTLILPIDSPGMK